MEKRKIWARIGVTLEATEEEINTALSSDSSSDALVNFFETIMREGRCKVDGDSYIPDTEIAQYNKKYGTQYEEEDYDADLVSGNLVLVANGTADKEYTL